MKNAYEQIKSILSTGVHHVEVETGDAGLKGYTVKFNRIETLPSSGTEMLVSEDGQDKWDEDAFDLVTVRSIRRIPLKPNILSVGTKVDVLDEDGKKLNEGVIECYFTHPEQYVLAENGGIYSPWQVIPHIEEEGREKISGGSVTAWIEDMENGRTFNQSELYRSSNTNSQDTIHSEEEEKLQNAKEIAYSKGWLDRSDLEQRVPALKSEEEQKLPSELIIEWGGSCNDAKELRYLIDHLAKKNNWKV